MSSKDGPDVASNRGDAYPSAPDVVVDRF